MPGSDTFVQPTSLDEAETLRAELTREVQSIQAQLGDKQRVDDDGNRLSPNEYWAWKKRAQHALNQKLEDLRAVKLWVRENRLPSSPPVYEARGHVTNLHAILTEMEEDGVTLDPQEKTKMDAAQDFLRRTAT